MHNTAVLITTPKLSSRACEILETAGLYPQFMPANSTDSDIAAYARQLHADGISVVAVVSRTLKIGAEAFDAMPDLRIVSKHGAGVDNIDVAAAKAKGITVTRTAGANARSVAELALGLIFAAARNIVPLATSTANGRWDRSTWTGNQLSGKTLGLLGFGEIGRQVASMGTHIFERVIVHDPYTHADDIRHLGAEKVELGSLRTEADILSLHCPLTEQTRNLIDDDFLSKMPRDAILINTARGEIIDEAALVRALEAGRLSGVGLDSLHHEGQGQSALRSHPLAVITPHIGGSTRQSLDFVAERCATNIVSFLNGQEIRARDLVS